MTDLFDAIDGEDPSPICPHCGVSAIPPEPGSGFVCENADCASYGDEIAPSSGAD